MTKIVHKDAHELAAGYSPAHRKLEIAGITGFLALSVVLGGKVWMHIGENGWLVAAAVLLGFVGADFTSGFVHWMADTWGSVNTPILGKSFIRPFREHHIDQTAITRHDFVETNGNNSLVALPVLGLAALVPVDHQDWLGTAALAFVVSLALFVFATNQIHKWSHQESPNRLVALLQRWNLILPRAHHQVHHTAPYDKYYCITVGWLNGPLTAIRFFRGLEWLVTSLTGALPRQDDIGREAALALAEREGIFQPPRPRELVEKVAEKVERVAQRVAEPPQVPTAAVAPKD